MSTVVNIIVVKVNISHYWFQYGIEDVKLEEVAGGHLVHLVSIINQFSPLSRQRVYSRF